MVATKKEKLEMLGVATRCIDALITHGLFSKNSAEYIIYERWLKDYKMPPKQSLNFYVDFLYGEFFSQTYTLFFGHKHFGFMADDSLWSIEDDGSKMAVDGIWLWLSTSTRIKEPFTYRGTYQEFEVDFKKHIESFAYSDGIKIYVNLEVEENEDDDSFGEIDDIDDDELE